MPHVHGSRTRTETNSGDMRRWREEEDECKCQIKGTLDGWGDIKTCRIGEALLLAWT